MTLSFPIEKLGCEHVYASNLKPKNGMPAFAGMTVLFAIDRNKPLIAGHRS